MNDVVIAKNEVLTKLRENRGKHRAIFLEAVSGYRKQAQELLERMLTDITEGKLVSVALHLPLPSDHTRDYDRVISMLEMSQGDSVALSEHDFAQYIQDDWQWRRQFLTSNSMYSDSATAALNAMQEDR